MLFTGLKHFYCTKKKRRGLNLCRTENILLPSLQKNALEEGKWILRIFWKEPLRWGTHDGGGGGESFIRNTIDQCSREQNRREEKIVWDSIKFQRKDLLVYWPLGCLGGGGGVFGGGGVVGRCGLVVGVCFLCGGGFGGGVVVGGVGWFGFWGVGGERFWVVFVGWVCGGGGGGLVGGGRKTA